MPKITDIPRWRTELSLAENFRDEELGKYNKDNITMAGENIDYYERGWTPGHFSEDDTTTTLNLFHAITRNVVPTLYFRNPTINAIPKRREDSQSAFFSKTHS